MSMQKRHIFIFRGSHLCFIKHPQNKGASKLFTIVETHIGIGLHFSSIDNPHDLFTIFTNNAKDVEEQINYIQV